MLLYLFLFLFGINFMLYGDFLLMIPFGVNVIKKKRIRVNITAIILIAFTIAYLIPEFICVQHPNYRLIFVPFIFLLGYNYFEKISEKEVISCYLVIAIGMAVHVVLSIVMTISRIGLRIGYISVFYDIWSQTVTATTGLMSYFDLFLPLFVYALVKKGKAYALIPVTAVGVLFGVITGNRSTLILFIASTIVGLIIIFLNGQYKLGFGIAGIIAALLLFVVLAYEFNWLGIKNVYDTSYLMYRIDVNKANGESLFQTDRWDTKLVYISMAFDHPWGGGELREIIGSYAHDIWLDTWSWGGWIAFLLLTVYLATFIYRMINFIRMVEDISIKILFSAYLTILFMQYLVEPILQGAPWIFFSACFFDGLISRYLADKRDSLGPVQV